MKDLDALGTRNYGDADKKRTLLRNLKTDHRLLSLIQLCQDDLLRDFEETANYLRENGTSLDRTIKQIETTSSKMLNTVKEDEQDSKDPEPSLDECMKVIQSLAQETSVVQAYNALKSPMVRTSLNIPTAIWLKLEPQLKQRINEIKDEIRKKQAQDSPPRRPPMPPQYPSPAQKVNAMMAQLSMNCMEETSSGEETDDDTLHVNVFHATMEEDLEVRANLGYVDQYSGKSQYFAISDGGADSCMVGENTVVISHTGRYATLVGYDPAHTKSKRIPIVTAYVKVLAQNGIPVLLKINEAVYNAGSPVTLLSKYQIREHGFVIDSVATKHSKAPGQQGTQRLSSTMSSMSLLKIGEASWVLRSSRSTTGRSTK